MNAPLNLIPGTSADSYAIFNSNADYHSDHETISSSDLKLVLRSAAHLKAARDFPELRAETKCQTFGTAVHTAVLEPDTFHLRYALIPANAPAAPTKAQLDAKKPSADSIRTMTWWKEFNQANDGKIYLKAADYEAVMRCADAIFAYDMADLHHLIKNAVKEQSIYWTDEETGLRCKCRPDAYLQIIIDVKKTQDARPRAFDRAIDNYGYDISAAHYMEGVTQFLGQRPESFIFIAVEEERPHGVWLHEADAKMLEQADIRRRQALRTLKQCIETDVWPGYQNAYSVASSRPWRGS